jgi:hypothetical protein
MNAQAPAKRVYTTAPKPEDSAAQEPKVTVKTSFKVGNFDFAIRKGVVIPADIPRAPNANELFFKTKFGEMEHNEELFVPTRFWTSPKSEGGREVPVDRATIAWQKGKVRDQFNTWKGQEEHKEARKDILLIQVPRVAGDEAADGFVYNEPGLSLFLQFPEDKQQPSEQKP